MQNGRPARESRDTRTGRSAGRSAAGSGARQGARASRSRSRSSSRSDEYPRSKASAVDGPEVDALEFDAPESDAPEFDGSEARSVRLNKYLASHGVASRRGCDELIADGAVMVDEVIVTDLGVKVDPSMQRVEVDGVVFKPEGVRHRYYLLNKPSGVVCTNSERELRPRAVDLITDRDKGRIFTVGRLDEETTGLILVTNDGEFANRVMHPRYGVDKTYRVKIAGKIEDAALRKIRGGVHLAEGKTSGARVIVQKRSSQTSRLLVTIQEGKNREVRRMFARAGFKVTDLRRVRIGPLTDRGLKPGSWRPLRRFEIEELLAGPSERSDAGRDEHRGRGRRGTGRGHDRGGRPMGRGGRRSGGERHRRRSVEEAPSFERRVVGEDAPARGRRDGGGGRDDRRGGGRDDRRDDRRGGARRDERPAAAHPAQRGSNRAARRTALEKRGGGRGSNGGGRRVVS